MTYHVDPVTQLDGDRLQWSNCLMAAAATGLAYHTASPAKPKGAKTSTASKMRGYSGDTSGGTNSDEIDRAWHTGYDEDPTIRDGQPWSKVMDDLTAGRLVMLQVWGATIGGSCMSGTGQYGHGIAVAPESRTRSGRPQWLVSDPLCKPARWVWFDESKLQAGAAKWAAKCAYEAGGARDLADIDPAVLRAVVRLLMHRWSPDHPATSDPPEVGGGVSGVLFASTRANPEDQM